MSIKYFRTMKGSHYNHKMSYLLTQNYSYLLAVAANPIILILLCLTQQILSESVRCTLS
jgi:hypothetical protein